MVEGEAVSSSEAGASDSRNPRPGPLPRLDLLKALGDNTRYAIYLEIARSAVPLSASQIAESLGLHVNTVRPHLERMRDVGLLVQTVGPARGVGRPQHLWSLAPEAPSLGLEPPVFPLLARLLLEVATAAGADPELAEQIGEEQGELEADRREISADVVVEVVRFLQDLGFDPEVVSEGADDLDRTTVAFMHCPFEELARLRPDLVCALHEGLVSGFVSRCGRGGVCGFRSIADRNPCQVDLVVGVGS